jgi:uncharacterized protein (TIGR01777 family)
MKVVLAGGSGQVGTVLARHFHANGNEVVVLSRSPKAMAWRTVGWDGETLAAWTDELEAADVVINLAGRSVNCRYTTANRNAILDSRVQSTRVIGKALTRAARPPRVWLQASTATIYAHRYDAPNDEFTGILGGGEDGSPDSWRFSIDVAKAWERAASEIETPRTRKVLMRSAMVMSPDRGGIFDTLLWLTRVGLGGRAGDGRQYVSWTHEVDFIRAVEWLVQYELAGAVNIASPNPLPYADFQRALREAWGMPIGMPASKWMIEIGTWLLRTESELVLKSRRVVPARLIESGFQFQFPTWKDAAVDLIQRRQYSRKILRSPRCLHAR